MKKSRKEKNVERFLLSKLWMRCNSKLQCCDSFWNIIFMVLQKASPLLGLILYLCIKLGRQKFSVEKRRDDKKIFFAMKLNLIITSIWNIDHASQVSIWWEMIFPENHFIFFLWNFMIAIQLEFDYSLIFKHTLYHIKKILLISVFMLKFNVQFSGISSLPFR